MRGSCAGSPGRICRVRPPTLAFSSSTRPLAMTLPAVDDRQLAGELLGLLHVLGGEQHGRPLGDHPLHLVPHLVAGARVEAGRRLVQVEHGRAARSWRRPGRAGAAYRRSTCIAGRLAASVSENRSSISSARRAGVLAGQVEQPPDHVEVLPAGELLVDRGVLAGEADGAAQLPGLASPRRSRRRWRGRRPGRGGWTGSGRGWSCRRRWGRAPRGRCPRARPGRPRPAPWSRRSA